MSPAVRRWYLALLVASVAGCARGEKLVPVTGKVMVSGKPAVGALVMFYTDGTPDPHVTPATATVKDDGSFSVATGATGGMRPGKYIVTVVWPDPSKKPTDAQRMMGYSPSDAPDLLAGRYATREKTSLRAEVTAGENALPPFDLK
ncbi:MAG: hypothetical protein U0746_19730 [Gemmataceae bacterium]